MHTPVAHPWTSLPVDGLLLSPSSMQQPPLSSSTPYIYPSGALQYLQQQQQQVAGYGVQQQSFSEVPGESGIQTCVRDSIRLLGEAVAVVEGVRLLGSQLLQWGLELSNVAQSLLPAALLVQIGRWVYTRTWGASRRRALHRMSKVWQEANGKLLLPPSTVTPNRSSSNSSSSSSGAYGLFSSSSRPRTSWARWLSTLGHLCAFLTLLAVAAELYVHFHVYRRLVARLRVLTGKGPNLLKAKRSSSSSNSKDICCEESSSSKDICCEESSSSSSSSS
ncbi:hypothetical protein Esti_005265 [Eimeria stiedai]